MHIQIRKTITDSEFVYIFKKFEDFTLLTLSLLPKRNVLFQKIAARDC